MGALTPRANPGHEGVTWDGTNDDEALDLVERVASLHVWAPLEHEPFTSEVHAPEEFHPGLCISNALGQIVVRIEEGNTLVFDPFAETPLFVATPEILATFYGTSD